MVFSFLAGLVALKWLSSWLEHGRWYMFGIYCLLASSVVFYLHIPGDFRAGGASVVEAPLGSRPVQFFSGGIPSILNVSIGRSMFR